MSGLGGAFHHPSTTSVDEIREQALYPDEDESRKHVAGEIFNPWRVVKGGGVWFVGGVVALILAFAAIADRSTRPAIHNFKRSQSLVLLNQKVTRLLSNRSLKRSLIREVSSTTF